MGRSTVYNNITSPEKIALINAENITLMNDFLEYLESIGRADSTIKNYKADLLIFFCWNTENLSNKYFVSLTKRDIAKFQNHAINEWGWSPRRIRTVKAVLSSLSNFIENILDDEYKDYKPIVRKIESPADEPVRDKTIVSHEELQSLLKKLSDSGEHMKACVLALAMYSGRRKSELTRFKLSYFDDENLICEGALYKTPEKIKTKGRGRRGKMLDVYTLAKPFKPYLDKWIDERNRIGINSEWLFPAFKGGQWRDESISTSTIDSYSRTYSQLAGKQIYPHALRHFFTSFLLEQNLPDGVVQNIQGWTSSDMVRVYDDRTQDSQLEKYFGADGIKQVNQKDLTSL